MAKEKRYVMTVDCYLWANTDEEAIEKAKAIAAQVNNEQDSWPELTELVEQPFGELGNRPVFKK